MNNGAHRFARAYTTVKSISTAIHDRKTKGINYDDYYYYYLQLNFLQDLMPNNI